MHPRKLLFSMLGLFFAGFVLVSPMAVPIAFAQPPATLLNTQTATFIPPSITPTSQNFICPPGTPSGWGTYTPSALWFVECEYCVWTPTSTAFPTETPTITPTHDGTGTPYPTSTATITPTATITATATPSHTLSCLNSGTNYTNTSCVVDGNILKIKIIGNPYNVTQIARNFMVSGASSGMLYTRIISGGTYFTGASGGMNIHVGTTGNGVSYTESCGSGSGDCNPPGYFEGSDDVFSGTYSGFFFKSAIGFFTWQDWEIWVSFYPFTTSTPTPTVTPEPGFGYCYSVAPVDDDFGFDLFIEDGEPNCEMGWNEFGVGSYTIPPVQICFQPSRFGVIRLFGKDYEVGVYGLAAAAAFLWRYFRTV